MLCTENGRGHFINCVHEERLAAAICLEIVQIETKITCMNNKIVVSLHPHYIITFINFAITKRRHLSFGLARCCLERRKIIIVRNSNLADSDNFITLLAVCHRYCVHEISLEIDNILSYYPEEDW
jgi:hypothetical protein